MEPLVDTVNQNPIITKSHLLKKMDISKMASGYVSFVSPFNLMAERSHYIHALVAYFDISFTKCRKWMASLQVDCSQMTDMAKEIVEANGFSNGDYHSLKFCSHSYLLLCCFRFLVTQEIIMVVPLQNLISDQDCGLPIRSKQFCT